MEYHKQLSEDLSIQFTYIMMILLRLKFNLKSLQQQNFAFTEDPVSKLTDKLLIYVGLLRFTKFHETVLYSLVKHIILNPSLKTLIKHEKNVPP